MTRAPPCVPCSVMLISRSEAKLKAVQAEIAEQYPSVKVDYAVADFSKLTPTVLAFLKAKLEPLDIGTLVNNVGVSYDFCQWFHELSDAEVRDMLAINIESVTWMTRLVLPLMLAKKQGAVVNMSSASARMPLPLLAQVRARGRSRLRARLRPRLRARLRVSLGLG